MAFNLEGYQFPGADAINHDAYDITAKVAPGASRQQLNHMLQNLLIERFKLTFHYTKKELPVYALVPAKGNIKLKASRPSGTVPADPENLDQAFESRQPNAGLDRDGYPIVAPARRGRPSIPRFLSGRARWAAVDLSMKELAQALTALSAFSRLDLSLVTDATDLGGRYDFTLFWIYDPDEAARRTPGFIGPTLQQALQEQLGLRLERQKAIIDIFVVDHVERPSVN
jgi:uncharacterized protein (TIGR03435 family)